MSFEAVAEKCTRLSDQERAPFPEIIAKLMAAGVERYHADLMRAEKIYYTPSGVSHRVEALPVDGAFAEAFSAAGVEAAVRASQAGAIGYKQFCKQVAAAGCVGYFVTLAGLRAVYYGRDGAMHVEMFPGRS